MRLTPVIDSSSNSLMRLIPMVNTCMIMTVRTMGIYGLNALESVLTFSLSIIPVNRMMTLSARNTRMDRYDTTMELWIHMASLDGMTAGQAELICLFSILNCYLQY